MKRVKRFCTYKRHWLWWSFFVLVSLAGIVEPLISADTHPIGYLAAALASFGGGLVAKRCKPQDIGDVG
jgi:hypothetical protein